MDIITYLRTVGDRLKLRLLMDELIDVYGDINAVAAGSDAEVILSRNWRRLLASIETTNFVLTQAGLSPSQCRMGKAEKYAVIGAAVLVGIGAMRLGFALLTS